MGLREEEVDPGTEVEVALVVGAELELLVCTEVALVVGAEPELLGCTEVALVVGAELELLGCTEVVLLVAPWELVSGGLVTLTLVVVGSVIGLTGQSFLGSQQSTRTS